MTQPPDQANRDKALELSHGILVLAGAGSGKTTLFVDRYLKLLESGSVSPRNIIAMTFTRKAASELSGRIYSKLLEYEQNPSNSELWRQARSRMPWARVGTIDSICTRLLRAYPMEAGVDPGFSVGAGLSGSTRSRVVDHLKMASRKRSQDLELLLDGMDRKKIESFIISLIKNPSLMQAAELAVSNQENAAKYLDETLSRLAETYNPNWLVENGNPNHRMPVDALAAACRLASGLIIEDQTKIQITFDEIQHLTLNLLRKNPVAGRQIRRSISQVMVDEFQDTSSLQWEIVQELARRDDGSIDRSKLFLVGDEKQSIYGFRQANVTIVNKAMKLMTGFSDRAQAAEQDGFTVLDTNFRSVGPLLSSLNICFGRMLQSERSQPLPFEAQPQSLRAIRTLDHPEDGEARLVLLEKSDDEGLFSWLIDHLKDVAGDDEEKAGGSKRFVWEDIAILSRTRKKFSGLVAALERAGVPYEMSSEPSLFARQEIHDLRSLLKVVADSRDLISLAGLLRSPFFSLSDTVLLVLKWIGSDFYRSLELLEGGKLPEGLNKESLSENEWKSVGFAVDIWRKMNLRSSALPAHELLLYLLMESGALSVYATGPRGDQRLANIYRFIDICRELHEAGLSTYRALVAELEELVVHSSGEEEEGEARLAAGKGVRIMTVHASKGLEFPYVILTDLSRAGKKGGTLNRGNLLVPDHNLNPLTHPNLSPILKAWPGSPAESLHAWMNKYSAPLEDEAESDRLLYVAATRACDRLTMVSLLPDTSAKGVAKVLKNTQLIRLLKGFNLVEEDSLIPPDAAENLKFNILQNLSSVPLPPDDGRNAEQIRVTPLSASSMAGSSRVLIVKPPLPDLLDLSITAFASYLANPDEARMRNLLWYSGDTLDDSNGSLINVKGGTSLGRDVSAQIGTILHEIYTILGPGCPWQEAEELVVSIVDRDFDDSEAEPIFKRLRSLIDKGHFMGLADNPVDAIRELALMIQLGRATFRGRVDLAWHEDDTAFVVDYKTNDVASNECEQLAIDKGYNHQVKLYGLGLMRAWGCRKAVARLAFVSSGTFVEYQMEDLDSTFYAKAIEGLWEEQNLNL